MWLKRSGVIFWAVLITIGTVLAWTNDFLEIRDRSQTWIRNRKAPVEATYPTPIPSKLAPTVTEQLITVTPIPTETLAPTPETHQATSVVVFCNGRKDNCYLLPTLGSSWPIVATQTSLEDQCKWPEIATQNRDVDGTYRIVGAILFTAGIYIPDMSSSPTLPKIRNQDGTFDDIPNCPNERDLGSLPCLYAVQVGDGLTGTNYAPLAWKYYGGIEKDGIHLDEHIMDANLADGCKMTPILLLPGVSVVIPMLP